MRIPPTYHCQDTCKWSASFCRFDNPRIKVIVCAHVLCPGAQYEMGVSEKVLQGPQTSNSMFGLWSSKYNGTRCKFVYEWQIVDYIMIGELPCWIETASEHSVSVTSQWLTLDVIDDVTIAPLVTILNLPWAIRFQGQGFYSFRPQGC